MKKILFIIIWTALFFVMTWSIGGIAFWLLAVAGAATWDKSVSAFVGVIWAVIFYAAPIVGFILGVLGKLPGTRSK